MKTIEFFVDTSSVEAYQYILELITSCNMEKLTEVKVLHLHSDGDAHYFHLWGSWEAYEFFHKRPVVDLNRPENKKYIYSLTHYEED